MPNVIVTECKNEEISRSFHGSENGLVRDQSQWSPSPTVSFCDNASCSAVQVLTVTASAMLTKKIDKLLQTIFFFRIRIMWINLVTCAEE